MLFFSAIHSPVPEIHWRKVDGQLPPNHEIAGAHLHLFNLQFEDSGTYECEASNTKGSDSHTARLSVEGKEFCCVMSAFFSQDIF